MINDENRNLKCLIFRYKNDYARYKLLVFKNREVAKRYYEVALKKPNFVHADTFDECKKWLNKNNFNYDIIKRDDYNVYE
jgi:hypothetical protein